MSEIPAAGGATSRRKARAPGFRRVKVARAFEDIARQIREEFVKRRAAARGSPAGGTGACAAVRRVAQTLREALRSLELAGLIVLRKGATGGAFVRDSNGDIVVASIKDMVSLGGVTTEQITEARIHFESAIIRVACERHTPADVKKLHANLAVATEAMRRKDFFARAEAHLEFHILLAQAARNPIMEAVMQALIDVMRQFIHTLGAQQINEYILPSRRRFMVHFEARNAEAACAEMERHLRRVNKNYLERLGRHAARPA